jgi:hypothetical protein
MDDQDWARIHGQLNRQIRFLLDRWKNMAQLMSTGEQAEKQGAPSTVSISLTCPHFEGSPVIAALSGFDEVVGCSEEHCIGKSLTFMSDGCDNDPQTIQFLNNIQASPQAALDFLREYPQGRQCLLLSKRLARMQPMYPADGNEKNEILFFNVVNVFAVKLELWDETYPVLVLVQWVLMHPTDIALAQQHTRLVQSMLTNPDGDLKEMFLQWVHAAVVRYIAVCKQGDSKFEPREEIRQVTQPPRDLVLPDGPLSNQVRVLLQRVQEAERRAQDHAKNLVESEEDDEQSATSGPEGEERERAKARARTARAQLEVLRAMLHDVCTHFHGDLQQHVAWYVIPAALMQAKETSIQ